MKKEFPIVWNKSKLKSNISEGSLWFNPKKPNTVSIFENGKWQEKKID
tara:strand:+ start:206 stop:349 length:144 start_codon:yes stop_codon:yes gene_type:complete